MFSIGTGGNHDRSQKIPRRQSYNAEKARSGATLEQGLEDTFPASDPLSATQPAVTSTIDGNNKVDREEAPLVDDALKSTGEFSGAEDRGRVYSLRRDAARLSDQASKVASGAVAAGKAEAKSIIQNVEEMVRERPLTAVGIVAAVTWFWGATR